MGILQLVSRLVGAADIAWGTESFSWTDENGISRTMSQVNASQIPVSNSVSSVQDMLNYFIFAENYGVPSQAALSDAIAYVVTGSRAIILTPGVWSITADMVIPTNASLRLLPGAILDVAAGKTLSGIIEAGPYQIISGTGTVSFTGPTTKVYPQWFGAKGDGATDDAAAIQAAIDACKTGMAVVLPATENYYKILSTLDIIKGIGFYGEGSHPSFAYQAHQVRIRNENVAGADAIYVHPAGVFSGAKMGNFALEGNVASGYGLKVRAVGCSFENITLGRESYDAGGAPYGHGKSGLYLYDTAYLNEFRNVKSFFNNEHGFCFDGTLNIISANSFYNCRAEYNVLDGLYIGDKADANAFYSFASQGNTRNEVQINGPSGSTGNAFYTPWIEGNAFLITQGRRTQLHGGYVSSLHIVAGENSYIHSLVKNITIDAAAYYTMLQNLYYTGGTLVDNGFGTIILGHPELNTFYAKTDATYKTFNIDQHGITLNNNPSVRTWFCFGQGGTQKITSDAYYSYAFDDYRVGSVAWKRAPAGGASPGWVCTNQKNTTTTGTVATGVKIIPVSSSATMTAGDFVSVLMDDGNYHVTTIDTVDSGIQITLIAGIPASRSVANGALVWTNCWKAMANLA